jgi:hypothetical protein
LSNCGKDLKENIDPFARYAAADMQKERGTLESGDGGGERFLVGSNGCELGRHPIGCMDEAVRINQTVAFDLPAKLLG